MPIEMSAFDAEITAAPRGVVYEIGMTAFHRLWTSTALLCLATTPACSSGSDDPKEASHETYMGLEAPAHGFQVRSVGTTIGPGEDVEYCEVAELPGTPDTTYFMNSVEMANGKGSHHLIVEYAEPGSPADEKLRAMNVGDRVPCISVTTAFGEGTRMVGGIQHPYGEKALPPGIAQKYFGGQRIVFDYHYYNATEDAVEARSAMNVHTLPEDDVEQLAAVLGFPNWTIDTPPGQKASFKGDCRFEHDTRVGMLVRHTHQWGRDFSAWFAGGARDDEHIWTTPDYETETDHPFEQPAQLKAGEGFRFECQYENTENHRLRFGVNATDEMCILFGYYWDAGGAYEPQKEDCQIAYTAEDGIGYPASHPKAFPPAKPEEAALCLSLAPEKNACSECTCNSCAGIIGTCVADTDCAPILACFTSGEDDCGSVMDEHSSGGGLSQQVSQCMQAKCAAECL